MPLIDSDGNVFNVPFTKYRLTDSDLSAFLAGGGDWPSGHVPTSEVLVSWKNKDNYGRSVSSGQYGVTGESAKSALKEHLEGPAGRALLRSTLDGTIDKNDLTGQWEPALRFVEGMSAQLYDGGPDFTVQAPE